MGATTFIEEVIEDVTMEEAYRIAVDRATAEYGNDGYNGTISTTNGVRPSSLYGTRRVDYREIDWVNLQSHTERNTEKWEKAEAFPVTKRVPHQTRPLGSFGMLIDETWSDLDIKRQAQSAAEDMVRQEAATTGQLEFPGKPTVKVDNFRELEIVAAKEVTEKQEQGETVRSVHVQVNLITRRGGNRNGWVLTGWAAE